jgi:hypothetical protein
MDDLERAKYPIGPFTWPTSPLDAAARRTAIDTLERVPALYRSLVESLPDAALDTPYRQGGWTIRQVVHHVPESHMNMYIRMKLALTEDTPTIRPYFEDRWALLGDAVAPVGMSLDLLDALHRRWVTLLRTLTAADFRRTFVHPDLGTIALDQGVAMYVWHSDHHAAHIRQALATRV